jgi:DNA-binding NtrC family response regulator
MKQILVIDDELEMLESLQKILSKRKEYDITLIQEGEKALEIVKNKKFDLIITDLKMEPVSGLDILKTTIKNFPESIVIMISGYGTIEAGVTATREGAFDFIEKPFTSKRLFDCIDLAFHQKQREEDAEDITVEPYAKKFEGIIYKSEQIENLINLVHKVSSGNMNILITGESGTGKELFARAIHNLSNRNQNPFVAVNCGALPEHLFESELFGHEKGAFTGAVKTKPGLLEFANSGTFFLDEIGDMSFNLQVKLLRMLEEKKIRKVGGSAQPD